MSESNQSFKITFVGEGFVGKTSLIKKYTKNTFNDSYIKTIGANFVNHQVKINSNTMKLIFWDIAGQDLFGFLKPSFLRGSKASIVVFSLEKNNLGHNSFEKIPAWVQDVRNYCGNIPIWLFANKADLIDTDSTEYAKLDSLIARQGIENYFLTSAKTGTGVAAAFESIINFIYKKYFT